MTAEPAGLPWEPELLPALDEIEEPGADDLAALRDWNAEAGGIEGSRGGPDTDVAPMPEAVVEEIVGRSDQDHSGEAEVAVLGAMLLDAAAAREVVEIVDASEFHSSQHGQVFQVMAEMVADGAAVDVLTVRAALRAGSIVNDPSGFLGRIAASVPSAANAAYYARMVHEYARRRRERDALVQLATATTKRRQAEAREQLEQLWHRRATGEVVEGPAPLDLADAMALPEPPRPDEIVDGVFVRGGLHVVFGAPGSGKSWLVLGLFVDMLAMGHCLGRRISHCPDDVCLFVYGSEDNQSRMMRRARKLWEQSEQTAQDRADVPRGRLIMQGLPPGVTLDSRAGQIWLRHRIEQTGATMLAIDTVSSTCSLDATSNNEVVPFMRWLQQLRDEFLLTTWLVHHTRKKPADARSRGLQGGLADSMLGATQWRGMCDGLVMVDAEDGNTDEAWVRVLKAKDLDYTIPAMPVALDKETGRFYQREEPDEAAPDPRQRRRKEPEIGATRFAEALRDAGGWVTRQEWAKAADCAVRTLRRRIDEGLIKDLGDAVEAEDLGGRKGWRYRFRKEDDRGG